MINQYKQLVSREIDYAISKIPKGDGTIKGLTKRLEGFQKLLKELM
jgi:hypothetical protein